MHFQGLTQAPACFLITFSCTLLGSTAESGWEGLSGPLHQIDHTGFADSSHHICSAGGFRVGVLNDLVMERGTEYRPEILGGGNDFVIIILFLFL